MMLLDTLVLEIRQLPITTRLALVEIIAESVRQELATTSPMSASPKLEKGMLRTEGNVPTDEELEKDYTNYLEAKYK